jgi:hypothetical protein
MKLKYFIPSLVAVVAAMFTGCSKDNDPTYLDGLRVSQSMVSIASTGGSASIDIQTAGSWTITGTPNWLTVSPASGSGDATVTFSADKNEGRNADLFLQSDGQTQIIRIVQGLQVAAPATCAEINAGPDGKTYHVSGVVDRVLNTTYGNWYIKDATGEVYVYGTLDEKGNTKNFSSLGIEAGDVVTIEGPKTTYNGTVELVDVTVVSHIKSLVKIEEGTSASFDANGGEFLVRLAVSGDGPSINIPADAKDWVGISSIVKTDSTTNVTFRVAANTQEKDRQAVIEFTSNSGSSSSTVSTTVSQMGLSGTIANPFSVADAIAYCQTLTEPTANDFFVKGKISKIVDKGEFGSYGNATFWISDDGVFNDDKSKDFECYRVLWLGNKKWVEGNAQISVGDEVLICGQLTLYKGTAETNQNKAYIYEINGVQDDANGIGSLVSPFNVAGAMAAISNGFRGNAYVEGVVSKVVNQFTADYGNGTFWISADGVYNNDYSKDFEAYRVYWLGNKKWADGDDQIAVGNNVVLYGELTKYKDTYETNQNKAYVYSVNGKTE